LSYLLKRSHQLGRKEEMRKSTLFVSILLFLGYHKPNGDGEEKYDPRNTPMRE